MRLERFMRFTTILLACSLLLAGGSLAGTIKGKVVYEGAVPKLRPLKMDADPTCASKHSGPVASEVLVLGEGNALANIFVRVTSGLPDKEWPVPSEPVVMDQNGCRYVPHVFGIMIGQRFRILNSDGIMHNVHALPKVNKPFNMAMPASRTEAEESFSKEEFIFSIKCDVHPWMKAYVGVMTHPFYDVTGTDGLFEISGLPAGTYEIEAWHEKMGTQKATVTVGADDTQSADFTFSPPKR